jgi:hypothetical protein
MTAIRRRKMLGAMLGGAVVATAGSSFQSLPNPRQVVLQALCPAAFAAARCAGGAGDVESAAGAGSRRMAGSGFRPLSIEGARHDHPSDAGDMGAGLATSGLSKRLSVSRKLLMVDTIA